MEGERNSRTYQESAVKMQAEEQVKAHRNPLVALLTNERRVVVRLGLQQGGISIR